mmetsp:Transcript_23510/g.50152  ORF Transcript_23510/g.50152 Transcript_23510/m.50152 type:complete len:153 (+) Transcript_23510:806-1264(+)
MYILYALAREYEGKKERPLPVGASLAKEEDSLLGLSDIKGMQRPTFKGSRASSKAILYLPNRALSSMAWAKTESVLSMCSMSVAEELFGNMRALFHASWPKIGTAMPTIEEMVGLVAEPVRVWALCSYTGMESSHDVEEKAGQPQGNRTPAN